MDEEKQKNLSKVIRNYSGFLDWPEKVASDIAEHDVSFGPQREVA